MYFEKETLLVGAEFPFFSDWTDHICVIMMLFYYMTSNKILKNWAALSLDREFCPAWQWVVFWWLMIFVQL